jgi:hypothetical protein
MWRHGRRLLHTLAAVAMGAAGSALLWAQTTITGPGPMTVGTTNATDVNLVTNNTARVIVSSAGHLLPAANNVYNLGSTTLQWGSAWLGGNLSVGGSGSITGNLSVSGSTVTLSGIPGGSTATDVLVRTGTGDVQYRAASGLVGTYAWLLTGNNITSAWDGSSGNFLGTTNAQPLVIATTNTASPQPIQVWVGNQETFRFNPPGASAPAWSIQRSGVGGGGGNQRGLHAVDLQSARSAATQVASGNYSVIGGGRENTASGVAATVGGGRGNTASGAYATVGGGRNNTASGQYSAIPGGYNLRVGARSFGFSGQTSAAQTDLSANSNIAAFVDVDLWLYSRDRTQASQLRFYEAQAHGSGAEYVAFQAPNTLTTSTTYTLPASLTPTSVVGAGILQTDASGNLSWLIRRRWVAGSAWALTGNSGTDPAVNFLGTTDAQPLVIRVGNQETFRFNPPGTSAPAWSIQRGGGGDPRGLHAVDLQSARSAATQVASGDYSVIGGGRDNTASGEAATVGGGVEHRNTASGAGNTAGPGATVGGGLSNTASGLHATVGGGLQHRQRLCCHRWRGLSEHSQRRLCHRWRGLGQHRQRLAATVGGGWQHRQRLLCHRWRGLTATPPACMPPLAGAGTTPPAGFWATVGGGAGNTASDSYATVGGGAENTASGRVYATVGGGLNNTASGFCHRWRGLEQHRQRRCCHRWRGLSEHRQRRLCHRWRGLEGQHRQRLLYATVGGGYQNTASGGYATVGGGYQNTASGDMPPLAGA